MLPEKEKKNLMFLKIENKNNNYIYFIIKNVLLLFFILHRYFSFIETIIIYKNELMFYKNYILDCKNSKIINYEENIGNNNNPYISVVIPVYNCEKYIENAIYSTINQSFKNFEIVLINDFSNDNTTQKIQSLQSYFNKIKIINHSNNMGIFTSRLEGILNSNGIYIIYIDSDDIFLNPFLFQKLYDFNYIYNIDIVEFIVLYQVEGKKRLYMPDDHRLSHYHNFKEKIIRQPELSNILFYKPRTLNYSEVICRTVWSKIVRKDVLLKTINFIGNNKNTKINYGEDTIMNVLNFQYSNNYSNINLPGYMYNFRKVSISHSILGSEHDLLICHSFLKYFKLFYKYIKYFHKDRNYFLFELKNNKNYLIRPIKNNVTQYILEINQFFNMILKDDKITNDLKDVIYNFSRY